MTTTENRPAFVSRAWVDSTDLPLAKIEVQPVLIPATAQLFEACEHCTSVSDIEGLPILPAHWKVTSAYVEVDYATGEGKVNPRAVTRAVCNFHLGVEMENVRDYYTETMLVPDIFVSKD